VDFCPGAGNHRILVGIIDVRIGLQVRDEALLAMNDMLDVPIAGLVEIRNHAGVVIEKPKLTRTRRRRCANDGDNGEQCEPIFDRHLFYAFVVVCERDDSRSRARKESPALISVLYPFRHCERSEAIQERLA
jgi:hypothetical protein